MPAYTAQELIDRAKAAADMHDQFVSPTQWLYWLTQERYNLDLFIARSGWPLDFETYTITVDGTEDGEYTVGTPASAATTAIMAIVAVHQVTDAGVRQLRYNDAVTFLRQLPESATTTSDYASYYRLRRNDDGLTLNMYPEPSAGSEFLVTYIAAPPRVILTTTSINYPMGWEERLVLGMARRALEKEESDSGAIIRRMVEMDQQIEEACWNRVISEAPVIRNTDALNYGRDSRMGLPPVAEWAWA